jgi:diguanylate cyclase (GGDEF)-like protein
VDALAARSAPGSQSDLQRRLSDAVIANPQIDVTFVAVRDGSAPRWLAASDATELGAHDEAHLAADPDQLALLRASMNGPVMREPGGDALLALAPIAGSTNYVVGARLKTGVLEERLRLLQLSTLGAFLTCVLAGLVLARALAQGLHARIDALLARCRALANGEPAPVVAQANDEFAKVLGEFDAMAERLRTSQHEREKALSAVTESNRLLEQRVKERTVELESATEKLKGEIESRVQIEALLAEAALTDPLTGLLNRRAMLEMLDQAVAVSGGEVGFGVVLADIDHFKRINDEYGHSAGDQVLVAVAQVLDTLQGDDARHASRWGGEEFLLLLPGVRLAESCRRAEELRRRIAALEMPVTGLKLSVSIGVAEYLPGEVLEDCLRRCDAALYRAKDAGRNAVVAARGTMFATMS